MSYDHAVRMRDAQSPVDPQNAAGSPGLSNLARPEMDLAELLLQNDRERRRLMRRALVAAVVLHATVFVAWIVAGRTSPRRVDAPQQVSVSLQFRRPSPAARASPKAPDAAPTAVPRADPAPVEPEPVTAASASPAQGTTVGVPSPGADAGPIRVLPGEGPGVIRRVEPQYPPVARAAQIEGKVVVDAVIRKDGSVSDVTVLSSTNRLFDQPCIDAVRQWRFTPGPQDVVLTVTVMFTLR